MELIFGIPSRRRKREEKYAGQTVLVVMPAPTEEGRTYRFELSLEAHKRLKLEEGGSNRRVGISFKEGRLFIANVTGKGVSKCFTYTNNRSFSNKDMHQYICETLKLDPTQEHILEIFDWQESDSANFIVAGELRVPSTDDTTEAEETTSESEETTETESEGVEIVGRVDDTPDTPAEAETENATEVVDAEPEATEQDADVEESAS